MGGIWLPSSLKIVRLIVSAFLSSSSTPLIKLGRGGLAFLTVSMGHSYKPSFWGNWSRGIGTGWAQQMIKTLSQNKIYKGGNYIVEILYHMRRPGSNSQCFKEEEEEKEVCLCPCPWKCNFWETATLVYYSSSFHHALGESNHYLK